MKKITIRYIDSEQAEQNVEIETKEPIKIFFWEKEAVISLIVMSIRSIFDKLSKFDPKNTTHGKIPEKFLILLSLFLLK